MNLDGRQARCGCGTLVPSKPELAFFEYRGEGSRVAELTCGSCRYGKVAHEQEQQFGPGGSITVHNVVVEGRCPGFTPHGPFEYDLYYCGCRGWD